MATLPTRIQAQASAITPTTLIHIVVTGDTSQSPQGSSYKATLGQLTPLFSSGTGNNIYNSDGVLSSGRVVDMNGNFLYFSGGSSNILFGFIGSGEKHLQWFDTALNWDLYNTPITNDLSLDRYSSLGGYLDTPFFVEFSTGNVGVGTNTPTEKLDVSGKTKTINFQMTSGATNGYVLTSDLLGNASWQPKNPYIEYKALLTQTGVSAPSESILIDTLSGGTWSYVSTGVYYFTSIGSFTNANKVEVYVPGVDVLGYTMSNQPFNIKSASRLDDDTIMVRTGQTYYLGNASGGITLVTDGDVTSILKDDILNNTPITIRVWS